MPSALLEIDSKNNLAFINYQTSTIFLRNSQLNIDLNIPKLVSEREKNLELVDRSRQWCRDPFNIFQREEATVPIRAIAKCSFEFLIEGRGRRCYNEHSAAYQLTVIFYQLRSTTDYRTGGRQSRRETAKNNAELPQKLATCARRTLYKIRGRK